MPNKNEYWRFTTDSDKAAMQQTGLIKAKKHISKNYGKYLKEYVKTVPYAALWADQYLHVDKIQEEIMTDGFSKTIKESYDSGNRKLIFADSGLAHCRMMWMWLQHQGIENTEKAFVMAYIPIFEELDKYGLFKEGALKNLKAEISLFKKRAINVIPDQEWYRSLPKDCYNLEEWDPCYIVTNPWDAAFTKFLQWKQFQIGFQRFEPLWLKYCGLWGKYDCGSLPDYNGSNYLNWQGKKQDFEDPEYLKYYTEVLPDITQEGQPVVDVTFDQFLDMFDNPYIKDPDYKKCWLPEYVSNVYTQRDYLMGQEEHFTFIRKENLQEDFAEWMGMSDYKPMPELLYDHPCSYGFFGPIFSSRGGTSCNHIWDSYKKDGYQQFYNDRLIKRVGEIFADDIDYWGFDFDTGATKNI